MALVYLPTLVTFYAIAIGCLFLFRIDKDAHEQNLAILRARATTETEAAE